MAQGDEPPEIYRPVDPVTQGVRLGATGCIGCITFVMLAMIAVLVFVLLLRVAS